MSLDEARDKLGWPSQEEIFRPTGVGASILAQLSEKKLGRAISRLPDGKGVRVGVLASNPDATESPLAILCDFPSIIRHLNSSFSLSRLKSIE